MFLLISNAAKAGMQSGMIMTISDIATQLLVEKNNNRDGDTHLDLNRTLRWSLAGLVLHGPYTSVAFSMLDRWFGAATSLKVVATKAISAQVLVLPSYLIALFALIGTLEDHPNVMEKIQTKFPTAYINGCVYWPIVNSLNFAFVPLPLRVPYMATSGGLWNSYLSWSNSKEETTAQELSVDSSSFSEPVVE
eukprot:Nitzschia sp. Nitz4//scaffold184_size43902//40243//40818//NITZ4_007291-RA/size43902-processed-gene-0.39-mRNA-1//1//CDS//3329539678//3685//frame0